MTTGQLSNENLYYRDIQKMLEQGLIEKVKRGYYHWIEDYGTSEVVIINRLFPDAVLCMDTALFYYKYSETLLSGISLWTKTLPDSELRLIIRLLKHTELRLNCLLLMKPKEG